jgi:hypothetical protein
MAQQAVRTMAGIEKFMEKREEDWSH